ncbi:MAG TPA: putative sugar nucleotidyl transferase, partial [Chryseosolibacter sp.]|nr:putative sugar nucleotidyl transferase [Chryseosolibacter sp.]
MNFILFDDPVIRLDLLPFTFTRPVARIRVGILTIDEKWEKWLGVKPAFQTQPYLQQKFPGSVAADNLVINGAVCPDEKLVESVKSLPKGYFLVKGQRLIAANNPGEQMNQLNTIE